MWKVSAELKGSQGEQLQVREGTDLGNSKSFMKGFLVSTGVYLLTSSGNMTKKETPGNLKWDCYNLVYL